MFKTEKNDICLSLYLLTIICFLFIWQGISFQLPLKIKENGAILLEAFLDILLPKILSSFTKYIFDTFFKQDYDDFFYRWGLNFI